MFSCFFLSSSLCWASSSFFFLSSSALSFSSWAWTSLCLSSSSFLLSSNSLISCVSLSVSCLFLTSHFSASFSSSCFFAKRKVFILSETCFSRLILSSSSLISSSRTVSFCSKPLSWQISSPSALSWRYLRRRSESVLLSFRVFSSNLISFSVSSNSSNDSSSFSLCSVVMFLILVWSSFSSLRSFPNFSLFSCPSIIVSLNFW
ncbi:unnamed protein product [Moneuplotes crassus]|uniref:Uncharacterized protein n=1 Tax=Euplotes crassus TaxID=5936 RepID=A0AAD2CX00_EUPCR|nr:unnamed protein product [Moneuplotes crassus]